MNFLGNSHFNMPSEKGELDASGVMALSLPWCDTLTSSTCFCISLSRSWTQTNSSVFLEYDRVDPSCEDVMNSTHRQIVPTEQGSLTCVASSSGSARRLGPLQHRPFWWWRRPLGALEGRKPYMYDH